MRAVIYIEKGIDPRIDHAKGAHGTIDSIEWSKVQLSIDSLVLFQSLHISQSVGNVRDSISCSVREVDIRPGCILHA